VRGPGTGDEPKRYVFDSFALLAYFDNEPGAEMVEQLLRQAQGQTATLHLSLVNLGAVYYIIQRERGRDTAVATLALIDQLPIHQEAVDRPRVLAASALKANHAISYADAFGAALGQQLHGPVVTGDPEFQKVAALVEVLWLPQR
jgi:predicted nucleic acid-binding protein